MLNDKAEYIYIKGKILGQTTTHCSHITKYKLLVVGRLIIKLFSRCVINIRAMSLLS